MTTPSRRSLTAILSAALSASVVGAAAFPAPAAPPSAAARPAASTPAPAIPAKPVDDPKAKVELADRFEALSYSTVQGGKVLPPVWRQAAALAKAAWRMNPTEPRYLRLLVDLRTSGGDADAEAAALNSYLTLVPDDQYAQARLIDLYVGRMQTVESILGYLRGIVAKTVLPAPLRAHAAVVCAQTLVDHSQPKEAIKMLNAALQIEPLNGAALHLKYGLSHDEGPSHRVGLLLAMLRSNPIQPEAATALAGELADAGLAEPSAIWYMRAANLYNMSGTARSPDLGKGAATEFYLCEHGADGLKMIEGYLSSLPYDTDAWAIRLAIVKDLPNSGENYDDLVHQAVVQATNRLQAVRGRIGAPNATTQPVVAAAAPATSQPSGQPIAGVPDLSADMALLVKTNQSQATDAYLAAAGDLAWMRLYFARDAGDGTQRILDELGRLLPADDPLLARLTGWSYLVGRQWDLARQKLSAVADRDPYAQLGMVLIDEQAGDKAGADALARSSLATHPSGAAAAVLYSAFHARGAKVIAVGQAEAMKAAITTFPDQWFDILSRPQEFYTVSAEPLSPTIAYTQSLLARITIQNTSEFDITMGDDGTIRPDMVFDASIRGLVEKQIPGAAVDRFWKRLLLVKGQSASEVVRLDRGDLAALLMSRSDVPIDVQFTVTFNPMRSQQGIVPGGAGGSVPFERLVERTNVPFDTQESRKKLYDQMDSKSAVERFRAVEELASFGHRLVDVAAGDTAQRTLTLAQDMFEHARPATTDTDSSVRAWASYLAAIVAHGDSQASMVQHMTQSDDWYVRLLGLMAAQHLPDHGALAASALSFDPDPVVKEFAAALSQSLTNPPAAGDQPGGPPAAPLLAPQHVP